MDRVAMLRQMIEKRPEDPFPRYGLAMELRTAKRLDESWVLFEGLMTDMADYLPTYLMAGNLLQSMGRIDEARGVLDRGMEVAKKAGDGHTLGELEAAKAELDEV